MRIATASDIKKIAPPAKGNERHPVDGCPSLYLKVTANGAWAWTLRYRPRLGPRAGADREITIGEFPLFGIGLAKEEYKQLRRRIRQGEDPLEEIQAARAAPTMRELAAVYLEEHSSRLKSGGRDRERFEKYILPRLGSIKMAGVEDADIAALHRSMKDKPVAANRTLSLLKSAFRLAIKKKWRPEKDNPAADIQRYREQARERYLEDDEFPSLFEALRNCSNQSVADAIRLLLLTAARKGEVLAMRWQDVNLKTGYWVKPTTKTGKRHKVPLNAPAMEVIARQPEGQPGDYVFPGRDLKWHWERIRKEAGLEDVRLHDLRHSAASILATDDVSMMVIGAVLGHSDIKSTDRYAHIHDRAVRAASDRLGRRLAGAERLAQ